MGAKRCSNSFSLAETEEYLKSQNVPFNRYQILEAYMILGGIPYYLKQLNKELTFDANIDNLFFRVNPDPRIYRLLPGLRSSY